MEGDGREGGIHVKGGTCITVFHPASSHHKLYRVAVSNLKGGIFRSSRRNLLPLWVLPTRKFVTGSQLDLCADDTSIHELVARGAFVECNYEVNVIENISFTRFVELFLIGQREREGGSEGERGDGEREGGGEGDREA